MSSFAFTERITVKRKSFTEHGTFDTDASREARDAAQEHKRSANVKPASQAQEFERRGLEHDKDEFRLTTIRPQSGA
jgi:hypothetical protein